MFQIRKMQSIAIALAALGCFATAGLAASPATTTPNLAYNAGGVFGATAVSGADLLDLAGQPFHLSVLISEATEADLIGGTTACTTKCTYSGINANMKPIPGIPVVGVVYSGLLPGTPIPLSVGTLGELTLEVGATGKPDTLILVFDQTVIGVALTITATIYLPNGTITSPAKFPAAFPAAVTLNSKSGTLVYADSSASTTLSFASGAIATEAN
jgi:hypothetical protein